MVEREKDEQSKGNDTGAGGGSDSGSPSSPESGQSSQETKATAKLKATARLASESQKKEAHSQGADLYIEQSLDGTLKGGISRKVEECREERKSRKWTVAFTVAVVLAGAVGAGYLIVTQESKSRDALSKKKLGSPEPASEETGLKKLVLVVLPRGKTEVGGERSFSTSEIAGDLWTGVRTSAREENGRLWWDFDDPALAIEIIRIADGPYAEDTVARIRGKLEKFDCLLVLGHTASTLALRVWRELYSPEKLPVILLGPTTPQITEDDAAKEDKVVLRMLPNDVLQVKRIETLLEERGDGQDILLVADAGNEVYSRYITEQLIRSASVGQRICGTLSVSLTDSVMTNPARLLALRPSVIVFVGMENTARAFLRGMERDWDIAKETPSLRTKELVAWFEGLQLLFTDGCASTAFHKFLRHESRKERWTELLVLSPMPPPGRAGEYDPNEPIEIRSENRLDYEPLGRAAAELGKELLRRTLRADNNLTNSGIVKQMSRLRGGNKVSLTGMPDEFPEVLHWVRFDQLGDNDQWSWYHYVTPLRDSSQAVRVQEGAERSAMVESGGSLQKTPD